jgi:hypothetical protein
MPCVSSAASPASLPGIATAIKAIRSVARRSAFASGWYTVALAPA